MAQVFYNMILLLLVLSIFYRMPWFSETMPFMHGTMPLRRTFYYLLQGKIKFRDDVQVGNEKNLC